MLAACHGDEHSRIDVFDEEPIQLRKNVDKGHPSAQVAHRLGVDSVRDQGGTNSVAGNVTDEQANVLAILRGHQREVRLRPNAQGIKGVDCSIRSRPVTWERGLFLDACSRVADPPDFHLTFSEAWYLRSRVPLRRAPALKYP